MSTSTASPNSSVPQSLIIHVHFLRNPEGPRKLKPLLWCIWKRDAKGKLGPCKPTALQRLTAEPEGCTLRERLWSSDGFLALVCALLRSRQLVPNVHPQPKSQLALIEGCGTGIGDGVGSKTRPAKDTKAPWLWDLFDLPEGEGVAPLYLDFSRTKERSVYLGKLLLESELAVHEHEEDPKTTDAWARLLSLEVPSPLLSEWLARNPKSKAKGDHSSTTLPAGGQEAVGTAFSRSIGTLITELRDQILHVQGTVVASNGKSTDLEEHVPALAAKETLQLTITASVPKHFAVANLCSAGGVDLLWPWTSAAFKNHASLGTLEGRNGSKVKLLQLPNDYSNPLPNSGSKSGKGVPVNESKYGFEFESTTGECLLVLMSDMPFDLKKLEKLFRDLGRDKQIETLLKPWLGNPETGKGPLAPVVVTMDGEPPEGTSAKPKDPTPARPYHYQVRLVSGVKSSEEARQPAEDLKTYLQGRVSSLNAIGAFTAFAVDAGPSA